MNILKKSNNSNQVSDQNLEQLKQENEEMKQIISKIIVNPITKHFQIQTWKDCLLELVNNNKEQSQYIQDVEGMKVYHDIISNLILQVLKKNLEKLKLQQQQNNKQSQFETFTNNSASMKNNSSQNLADIEENLLIQLNSSQFTYENLLKLQISLQNLIEIALRRAQNWVQYCQKNKNLLAIIQSIIFSNIKECQAEAMKLLQLCYSQPSKQEQILKNLNLPSDYQFKKITHIKDFLKYNSEIEELNQSEIDEKKIEYQRKYLLFKNIGEIKKQINQFMEIDDFVIQQSIVHQLLYDHLSDLKYGLNKFDLINHMVILIGNLDDRTIDEVLDIILSPGLIKPYIKAYVKLLANQFPGQINKN